MEPPVLHVGDWIRISGMPCIVADLYSVESRSSFGIGVVVYNPDKPTSHDFDWDGEKFHLPKRPDFGGYAERSYPSFARELKEKYGRKPRRRNR